ncbi:MAG: sensor histidine kinase [Clostridia bacterium]|nr:sensor histidine kinase [Clostridia bacterium]
MKKLLRSFQFRMIVLSFLVILLTLVLAVFLVFGRYEASMADRTRENTMQAFHTAGTQIDQILSEVRNTAAHLQQSLSVERFLFGTFASDAERMQYLRSVLSAIDLSLVDSGSLNGLFFLKDDGTMIGATRGWHFVHAQGEHSLFLRIRGASIPVEDRVVWLGTWNASDMMGTSLGQTSDTQLIAGAYRTKYRYSFSDSPHYVTTVFSVKPEALRNCFAVLEEEDREIFLLDSSGRQIIGPNADAAGEIPWFYGDICGQDAAAGTNLMQGDTKYQMLPYRLENSGWMLVKKTPYDLYRESATQMRHFTWIISLAVLAMTLIVYTVWVSYLFRPFKSIRTALERIQKQDLSVRLLEPYQYDEFELIRTEFNSMADSISYLLEQTRDMEHQRIELELRNLQSQLNPHMLFNSMTAIRWMAMMSGAEKVSDMLIELAELIRPLFAEWRLVWSLRDELAYLGHYTKLLRLRYGGVVDIRFLIEETLQTIQLPCFTLQPLIENSVEHGIGDKGTLTVTVEGSVEGDCLVMRVMDNGQGMEADKLERIREKIRTGDASDHDADARQIGHSGIGLVNIHRRLIMYGGSGGLSMESEKGVGTTVTIRIPIHPEQEPATGEKDIKMNKMFQ